MDNFNFISELLDGRVVLGAKEQISETLYIIPVYKVKITFLNLKTDIKSTNGDGASGSITVNPICLLKVNNNLVDVINFNEDSVKEGINDLIPNVLSNLDVSNLFKNFKFN